MWAAIEDGRLAPPGTHLEDFQFLWMYPSYVPYNHKIVDVDVNQDFKMNLDMNLHSMDRSILEEIAGNLEMTEPMKVQRKESKEIHCDVNIENEMKKNKNKIRCCNRNSSVSRQIEKTDSNSLLSYSRINEKEQSSLLIENQKLQIQNSDKCKNFVQNPVKVRNVAQKNHFLLELSHPVKFQDETSYTGNTSSIYASSSLV